MKNAHDITRIDEYLSRKGVRGGRVDKYKLNNKETVIEKKLRRTCESKKRN
jgi:hypothetical protein